MQSGMKHQPRKAIKGVVICDSIPGDNYEWRKLFDYGVETGKMMQQYEKTNNEELLLDIMKRYEFERDAWLSMTPPEYAGAAKICINMESTLYKLGKQKHEIKKMQEETDKYVALSSSNWKSNLQAVLELNRESSSILSSCENCGKCFSKTTPKRLFCGKCKLAVYCSQLCQKQHWDEVHRKECGKLPACACCDKLLYQPMTCGRCHGPKYCNRMHQKWHWKHGHKEECSPP